MSPTVKVTIETESDDGSSVTSRQMRQTEPAMRLSTEAELGICLGDTVAQCGVNSFRVMAEAINFLIEVNADYDHLDDAEKIHADAMCDAAFDLLHALDPSRSKAQTKHR